ncbi:MAG TPA: hypothetical protein VKA84_08225 [Gemmatimonadaceae bacterium]|nr:hypothetical protein [Gemmatimonadaceae bacterium]
MATEPTIRINRAPVLTLWAAVVAERMGHDRAAALTLGRAVAGLNAQSKGRRLGVFEESPTKTPKARRERLVSLLGRQVRTVKTSRGVRAVEKGKPTAPTSVERYLKEKFGEALPAARSAMEALARAYTPEDLEEIGFSLYEQFRPRIPEGARGWGAKGPLDLDRVRELADRGR